MIEDDLSQVEESATKSSYKLGVGFETCENKGDKSGPKFIPSSNYHKVEETIKSTKAHYPSNPKPTFNTKRDVKKETPKQREQASVCMVCGISRTGKVFQAEFLFDQSSVKCLISQSSSEL
jgi:hypothetical protein